MKTLFERIIEGELPCDKVFESKNIIAFKDIHPQAPVHILIVTKKAIPNIQSLQKEDFKLVEEIVKVAQDLAIQFHLDKGYRLVVNNGEFAGQVVPHLHFHLLGGGPLGEIA